MNRTYRAVVALALTFACVCGATVAAGAEEDGFKPLFNGMDLAGWDNGRGEAPGAAWVAEDGALTLKGKGGGYAWTKERFGNFVLDLEVKTKGNSGVFIRTDNPRDNVQTGIEIQIDTPRNPSRHSVGAVYDLVAPTENAAKEDWNQMVITAKDNQLQVELNGRQIISMDLNRWTTPSENPDGSKNKFRTALKDFKREGHIGFQDHGAVVAAPDLAGKDAPAGKVENRDVGVDVVGNEVEAERAVVETERGHPLRLGHLVVEQLHDVLFASELVVDAEWTEDTGQQDLPRGLAHRPSRARRRGRLDRR